MTGPEAAVLVVVFAWGALAGGLWRRDRTAHWRNIAEWNGEETEAIKGADLDEDVAQYRRRRTSGEHPAVEDPAPPSWMDQSGYRPPAASLAAQRQVVFEDDDDPSELGPLATGGVVPSSSAVTFSESDGCVVPDRPPMANGLHVSRGWDADRFAPDCGCEIAHCGLVIPQTGCLQHDNFKTFRQAHRVEECPAYADDPAEQPWVHTPCGTPISVTDDREEWCLTCVVEIVSEIDCPTCRDTGMVPAGGNGSDGFDRCPDCPPRCGDISPVTGAACQHPPGHTIRHVGPLGEGTYRERWGDFPDLDASDGPRSLPNGRID